MNAIAVRGVTKRFGERIALDNVSFDVRPGKMTGFVGANGAGKTTTMRVIMGLLLADAGEATFAGAPLSLTVRRRFGYMPEERGLYPKMKIGDQLRYFGRLHGLDAATAAARVAELLGDMGLTARANEELTKLSLGNQQRVQVVAALLHDPVALILDEPFSGLDPLAVDAMAQQVRGRAEAGVPVLFSSHQLDLVERLCDDIVILSRGTVVAAGPVNELRARHAKRLYRVVLSQAEATARLAASLPAEIGTVVEHDGVACEVQLANGTAPELLDAATRAGQVLEFTPHTPSLADVFREVIA